jgi:hypothetical protein
VFEQARQGFTTKSTKDTKVTKKASVRTLALHSLLFSSWCSWCPWWLICFLLSGCAADGHLACAGCNCVP